MQSGVKEGWKSLWRRKSRERLGTEPLKVHAFLHAQLPSHVQLFVTPRTKAHQAPLSMRFCCKNAGAGCHFLLQGIFLTQGSNPSLLLSPLLAGGFFTTTSTTWEARWSGLLILSLCFSFFHFSLSNGLIGLVHIY